MKILGYLVTGLLIFRLAWGFVGTRHVQFSDFLTAPNVIWAYVGNVAGFRSRRHLGHNPAGGVMILVLLLLLTIIVVSEIMQLSIQFFGVPWVEGVHHQATNVLLQ